MDLRSIPVYVINLRKDVARKQHMESLLNRLGLEAKFVSAFDGRDVRPSDKLGLYDHVSSRKNIGRVLTRSEIGCAYSHISIYKEIVSRKNNLSIVFEDDVIEVERFTEILSNLFEVAMGTDVVLLGSHASRNRNKEVLVNRWSRDKIFEKYCIARPVDLACGAYGYMVSLKGAEKLLRATENLSMPIDHYTGDYRVVDVSVVNPSCVCIYDKLHCESNMEAERKRLNHTKVRCSKRNSVRKNVVVFLGLYSTYSSVRKFLLSFYSSYLRIK